MKRMNGKSIKSVAVVLALVLLLMVMLTGCSKKSAT